MTERYYTSAQAAEMLPGSWNARSVQYAMNTGTSTPKGIIKLKRTKFNGVVMTTHSWINEYTKAIDAAWNAPSTQRKPARPTGARNARQSLASEGIK